MCSSELCDESRPCNNSAVWQIARKKFQEKLQELFSATPNVDVMKQAFENRNELRTNVVMAAYFAAEFASLAKIESLTFTDSQQDVTMLYGLITFLSANSSLTNDSCKLDKYSTKFQIIEENIGPHKMEEILHTIGIVSTLTKVLRHNTKNNCHYHDVLHSVTSDGAVYDRARDPPGQRSVYIPPGNPQMESYRLSTFIKYPQEVPVNPRHLAAAGFYYVGFKDRVKCFSCGLCVEDWVYGDDVTHAKWHRIDCAFIKGQDSGNISIGSGGFARFMQPAPVPNPRHVTDSRPHQTSARYNHQQTAQTARQVTGSAAANHNSGIEFATIPSAYHENFLKNLDLRQESERLRTFEHFPTDRPTVSPNDLARSGFFYLGNLDRVQCFSCAGVLRNWNYGDNVHSEHRRHFSHCRLVQGAEGRNVPLTPEERAAAPQQQVVFHEPPDPTEIEQRDLRNMFQCRYPVNPHMRNEEARFETFDRRWESNNVNSTPRQIARAGFFYLGERDRVKCWYCNGGLQNFDPQDEPWTEHAKWFPTCEFLLQRKGPDFVHRMVSLFPNLPRPVMRGAYDVPPRDADQRSHPGVEQSAPVEVIDPQEELRREDSRLDELMRSDVVKSTLDMGFDRRIVRRLIQRRARQNNMYTRVDDIIDDVEAEGNQGDDETIENHVENGEPPEESIDEETTPSMQQQIDELRAERMCRICRVNTSDLVLVPCGHLCSCANCNPQRCPLCNRRVEKSIRAFIT